LHEKVKARDPDGYFPRVAGYILEGIPADGTFLNALRPLAQAKPSALH